MHGPAPLLWRWPRSDPAVDPMFPCCCCWFDSFNDDENESNEIDGNPIDVNLRLFICCACCGVNCVVNTANSIVGAMMAL